MDKKIIIHFGPPKTGTSAIQSWLNSNRDTLLSSGILYPEHKVDENNVSSGNHMSIFTNDRDNELKLDNVKINALLKTFEKSVAHTLLLSSEYFFLNFQPLAMTFPNAVYVGYVRSPLEFMESDYNQSIKRHGNTNLIRLKPRINASIIRRLSEDIEKIGNDRFHLRGYCKSFFLNGDILGDFLSYLELPVEAAGTANDVNTSYGFEALELKRWLNQFELGSLSSRLDSILQRYDKGINLFSLISPQAYKTYRVQTINAVIDFCKRYKVENEEQLIAAVKQKKPADYMQQVLTLSQAVEVVTFIKVHIEPYVFTELCHQIQAQKKSIFFNEELCKAFILPSTEVEKQQRIIDRIRTKILLKTNFLKKMQNWQNKYKNHD
jgi:hypothetical protein